MRSRPAVHAAAVVAAVAAAVPLGGCSAFTDDAGDGPRVVTSFYPLQYVAERVAGEHAEVLSLTQPGAEPHDLELTIAETAEIARADLVVHLGGFQPAVDDSVEQNAPGAVLDVGPVADLVPATESPAEHEHDGHDHEEHEGHDHGDVDPHFWLDPLRMADVGDALADELAEVDAEHSGEYAANAAGLRADLEELDRAFSRGLAGCELDTVVVSHDAFRYLERYGLHFAPVAGLTPGAEPGPADLAGLQQLIDREGITTVFSERLASRQLTAPLAEDLGIGTGVLDPLEGLTEETAGEDYVTLMQQNLDALREANRCR